jgi:hypothetical protein
MLEMVQKHTVPDSADWQKITPMVERAREMRLQHKKATKDFVRRRPPSGCMFEQS